VVRGEERIGGVRKKEEKEAWVNGQAEEGKEGKEGKEGSEETDKTGGDWKDREVGGRGERRARR
jgi:hypothetical protein